MFKILSEIEGFEKFEGYKVFSNGTVVSIKKGKDRILKNNITRKGYHYVKLYTNEGLGISKTFPVHRLVAFCFIENKEDKSHVNHIDGNKTNNNVENLEWVTVSENNKHAFKLGLSKPRKKELNYQWNGEHENCKKILQYDLDGNFIAEYKSIGIASRETGCRQSLISKTCNGYQKYTKNFIFKFKE